MVATRKAPAKPPSMQIRHVRCAIYCRKSNTEGLDGDFSSLVSQREACARYIESQAGLGWVLSPTQYSDGGYTGANTDRPGFQQLMTDIQAGKIDAVVVYKIDRLSRSLRDFGQLIDLFERHGVSFVSVTQRFDTSSSMGKLTLNILMSFAEFEREVTRERILDKIGAAKRRGKHCGGMPVLGYNTDRVLKRLLVNVEEANLVRHIFERFVELRSTTRLATELNEAGYRTKSWPTVRGAIHGGRLWNKAHLYRLLNNPKYIGLVDHHGQTYPGEHEAIVPKKLWDQAHAILAENYSVRANCTRAKTPALLRGIIRCAHCDCSMGPTFTRKKGKTYRYYLCVHASKKGYATCPVRTVGAGEIEAAVLGQLRAVFRTPEVITRTFREAKSRESMELDKLRREESELKDQQRRLREMAGTLINANGSVVTRVAEELSRTAEEMARADKRLAELHQQMNALKTKDLTQHDVTEALGQLDPVWDALFPAEQSRIIQHLIERVDVLPEGLELRLRAEGLRSLVAEMRPGEKEKGAAG